MRIERFEDIEVWQPVESLKVERRARELTRKVYRLTKKPQFSKDYFNLLDSGLSGLRFYLGHLNFGDSNLFRISYFRFIRVRS